ncbi:MAG: hypothetical protein NVS1B4_11390 [Gemmatimonadaceae bacterium]
MALLCVLLSPAAIAAQGAVTPATTVRSPGRALSLDEAIATAQRQSETVRIAETGVMRARGEQYRARSGFLPQLTGSAQYTRTLRSQFQGLSSTAPRVDSSRLSVCAPSIPSTATPAERQAAFDRAVSCPSSGGLDFGRLPFGRENSYNLSLSGSQVLFAGGRVVSQNMAANAGRNSAEIELGAQRAQLQLDVASAYYDAVLGDRLLAIAESSLVQTEKTFRQVRLARAVGNKSEFELLRSQVTRDNVRPTVIARRTQRELAYLRLKQLLNLPLSATLRLTTELNDREEAAAVQTARPAPEREVRALAASATAAGSDSILASFPDVAVNPGDTASEARAPVREAVAGVRAQQAYFRVARAQRFPQVVLSSQFGRVAYPTSGLPVWNDFLSNWTVSLGAQIPLFTGGRIRGDELVAEANVIEAQQRLQQARQFAALDARSAVSALQEAEASFAASVGTTEQAQRAYAIAEVRYREGISTQVELTDSRILAQQAQANRSQAARDLQIARLRLRLLPDLPLQQSMSASASQPRAGGSRGAPSSSQSQQATQTADPTATGTAGGIPQ